MSTKNPLKHFHLDGQKVPLNSADPFHQEVKNESKYPTQVHPHRPENGTDFADATPGSSDDRKTFNRETGRESITSMVKGKVEVSGNHPNKKLKQIYG